MDGLCAGERNKEGGGSFVCDQVGVFLFDVHTCTHCTCHNRLAAIALIEPKVLPSGQYGYNMRPSWNLNEREDHFCNNSAELFEEYFSLFYYDPGNISLRCRTYCKIIVYYHIYGCLYYMKIQYHVALIDAKHKSVFKAPLPLKAKLHALCNDGL